MLRPGAPVKKKCVVCKGEGFVTDPTRGLRGVQDMNTMSNIYARSVPRTEQSPYEENSVLEREKSRLERQKRALVKQCERLQRQLDIIENRQKQIAAELGLEAPIVPGQSAERPQSAAPQPREPQWAASASQSKWRPHTREAPGSAT